jgi:hypothetical protein
MEKTECTSNHETSLGSMTDDRLIDELARLTAVLGDDRLKALGGYLDEQKGQDV